MKQMNLYCTGGLGINIGKNFIRYMDKDEVGFTNIVPFFIDASQSNLNDSALPEHNVYLVDGLDGSGKLRSSNYGAFTDCIVDILYRFKPGDINVVIHSSSGGSGSTLGPLLVSELISKELPTVVINVGSSSCRIETENTIKTLMSYAGISKKQGKPINMYYRENTKNNKRAEVDQDIQLAIIILAAVFSGDNDELDSADLYNFLNYTRVTSYDPNLNALEFFNREIKITKGRSIISLVTLVDELTSSEPNVLVEYQTVGRLNDNTKKLVTVELPIHSAIVNGYFVDILANLNTIIKEHDDSRRTVVNKSIIDDTMPSDQNGMFL